MTPGTPLSTLTPEQIAALPVGTVIRDGDCKPDAPGFYDQAKRADGRWYFKDGSSVASPVVDDSDYILTLGDGGPDILAAAQRVTADDAHLIAAAPDLLAACENALGAYEALAIAGVAEFLPGFARCRAKLEAAVAKARGGGA